MFRTVLRLTAWLCFVVGALIPALGQAPATTAAAQISGQVTDPQGAAVASADVHVINEDTSARIDAKTDAAGNYKVANLPPGRYLVSIEATGFETFTSAELNLDAGKAEVVNAQLALPAVKEEANVTSGAAAQIELENAQLSGTITQKEVTTYQLNGRNFSQLIALAPGVSNQTGQDEGKVGVVGSVKYSVNGGRVEYNTFEVDGSDVLNTGLNGAASTLVVYPSLDAIQEVKVLTSNYGAQFGRTASGTVQVTTRSGGDKFHGNLYEFLRNEVFNSRNYFDQSAHAPLYRRHDFGGTIGGPLSIPGVYNTKKDKTFFFFSEEARLEKSPTQYNQAVPSLKERGLIMTPQGIQPNLQPEGNSGILERVFDFTDVCPAPGSAESAGFGRQQFPDCPSISTTGNSLVGLEPLYNIFANKNAVNLLSSNLIPLPNSPTGCSFNVANLDPTDPNHCYDATVSPSTYYREELFRVDHNFNAKTSAMFRYIHDSWDTTVLTPQWGTVRNSFPTVQNRFIGPGTSLVARLTETLTPTLVNEFTASYVNSTITLADRNGPGGATFQRNPSLDQPLVTDPNFPGQCNPLVSQDPFTGLPQCAIGHLFNNGFSGKNTGLSFTGTNAAYGGQGFAVDSSYEPWKHSNPIYSIRDDVTKGFGKHTLTFGAQFIYSQRNQTNNAIGAATGDQQGLLTFSNLVQSTGNAFADFLLEQSGGSQIAGPGSAPPTGYIQSFTQDSSQLHYYQRYQIAEPYFQDDWKITKRLTLNLGLRVSLFGTYREKNHNAWNFVPSQFDKTAFAVDPSYGVVLDATTSAPILLASGNQLPPDVIKKMGLVQCGVGGTPVGCLSGHLFNPAPRIGFAWDPAGDGKTSIRGGYGIFFEHGTGNETNTGSLEGAAPLVLNFTQHFPVNYACIGEVGLGSQVDPNNSFCGKNGVPGNPPPANAVYPLSVTAIPGKAIWPYAQQWSFSIQRQLPHDSVATLAYVGSKGTKLTIETQQNQLRPVAARNNPFGPNEPITLADCGGNGGSVFNGVGTPFTLQNGTVVTQQDPAYPNLQAACASPHTPDVNSLPRPYPGLGKVLSLENAANSSYHALQATLRRTKGPLTAGVSYSFSHSIDNASDRSDPVLPNSYDLRSNRASSNFDERHLLNVSYVYQLPKFSGRFEGWGKEKAADDRTPASGSRILQQVLDGWNFSGITLFQSGTPFSVINGTGNTGISLSDNAGVSSGLGIAPSYPDVVKDASKPGSNSQSFGPLLGNPSIFVAPRGLTFGNAGRNFLNNPSRLNFDMALLRHFKILEHGDLEFRAEAFNVFNHTQFRVYDPDNPGIAGNNLISCYAGSAYSAGFQGSGADCVTGASFLHPINAHRPRTLQFGLKLGF